MPPSTSTATGTTATSSVGSNLMPPSLPTQPLQMPPQPVAAASVAAPRPQTIIRMGAPGAAGAAIRPGLGGNIVRVRAPGPMVGAAGTPGQIKVVGAPGQPHVIKTSPAGAAAVPASSAAAAAAGNMSGIAALAAAAAATSKISTDTTQGAHTITTAGGQAIKVVQGGANLVTSTGMKVAAAPVQGAHQTAVIGGQTVRLASPGGAATLLKTGTTLAIKPGMGGAGQPQVVTLVKTSQGMQVVPKASIVQQGGKPAPQQIIQTQAGKTIPQVFGTTVAENILSRFTQTVSVLQGATIVKLVNASQAQVAGQAGKIVTGMKTLGTNVVTVAGKPGMQQVHVYLILAM